MSYTVMVYDSSLSPTRIGKKLHDFLSEKDLVGVFCNNMDGVGRVDSISEAFTWWDTEQGDSYWRLLSEEFKSYRSVI